MYNLFSEYVWFASAFAYIGDFLGALGAIATVPTGFFIEVLRGYWGNPYPFRYTNVVTGIESVFNFNQSILTDILSAILNAISSILPPFVYDMPLFCGVLVACLEWFFIIALFKFFKGIIFS